MSEERDVEREDRREGETEDVTVQTVSWARKDANDSRQKEKDEGQKETESYSEQVQNSDETYRTNTNSYAFYGMLITQFLIK